MLAFPTEITKDLFIMLVAMLAIVPILDIPASIYLVSVYRADVERPRNRILRLLTTTAVLITIVSIYISTISFGLIAQWLGPATVQADFGGVTFAFALLLMEITPLLKARTLRKLDGNIERIAEVPEKK